MTKITVSGLIEQAAAIAALIAQAEELLPQLVDNFNAAKDSLSSNSDAEIRAQIDAFHGKAQSLTAQLDALRDPEPEPEAVEEKPAKAAGVIKKDATDA